MQTPENQTKENQLIESQALANETPRKQKNWSLWIGLLIPVLMMVFIALSIYLPRIFDNTPAPSVDFLYTTQYSSYGSYAMDENALVWNESKNSNRNGEKPKLYLYDVSKGASKVINFSEDVKLNLQSAQMAPDGYKLERSRHNGFFLFDWRSSRDYYLVNNRAAYKVNLEHPDYNYYSVKFLAWDMNGEEQ